MKLQATSNPLPTIGNQIRTKRRQAGMSQQVLADKVGIFRTYLSRVENATANPTILVLAGIAQELGVDLSSLLVEVVNPQDG